MANIYEIDRWVSGEDYQKNDVIYHELEGKKYYWYALMAISSSSSAPSLTNTEWGGVKYSERTGLLKPHFIWKPSYNLSIGNSPRVRTLKFGDGYEQRVVDGIDSVLLRAGASFELRDSKEARAIAHFFAARKGTESFILKLPPPYDLDKLYVVRSWSSSIVFYNNYSFKTEFEEVTK
jgi:phage-related protein